MWKSCLQVRDNDTAKSYKKKFQMKVKGIVNVDMVYIVHLAKVVPPAYFGDCQRDNISCICFFRTNYITLHVRFKKDCPGSISS